MTTTTSFIWMALCCLLLPKGARSQHLNSLISLSELLDANPPISEIGNVNVVETSDEESGPIPICYMPYLFPFTLGDGVPANGAGQYEGLAAIALAMEHLNTGNGAIIPELDGINQRCPMKFTTKSYDTEAQQSIGANHVIKMTDSSRPNNELLPCAIFGAARSVVSIPTSIISGIRGFPQISPRSTSSELDDTRQYNLFGRTVPNDDGTSIPLLRKLTSWGVNYLAVLHIDDPYGNAFAERIRLGAQMEAPGLRVVTVDIVWGADDAQISAVIKQLRETEFTYFFGIIHGESADKIMEEAVKQGIAGTGRHTWLFSDGMSGAMTRRDFPVGHPLVKAYRGAGVLTAVGGVSGMEAFDKLTRSMQQLGESMEDRSYLDAHLPRDYPDGKIVNHTIITSKDTFLKSPGAVGPFLYDAVVALGLASCGLVEISGNNEYFTGEELFKTFKNTTFEGTSGTIVLDPETGSRDPRSAHYTLINFIDDEDASLDQDLVKFKGVETDLFRFGKWESLDRYIFSSGTSEIPLDLPVLETNTNYLSTGLKVVGSILCGIIITLALGFSYWTYYNDKKRVVRTSQPIFLQIISAGTLLMGLSIIPLTIDLGVTDQKGADAACVAFPWLVAIGFSLTFSALFTKTYRINQIMRSAAKLKRLKLTAADVMKPMIALLTINVVVLTVWTVVDPLHRQTVIVSQDSFDRDLETYGVCSSEYDFIFLAILGTINLGSLLIAIIQSYMARDISTELQESNYIFMAMAFILLVSFIAIPVMTIAQENVDAFYFVLVCLIFVVCASVLLLIFVPKVQALRRKDQERKVTSSTFSRREMSSVSSQLPGSGYSSPGGDSLTRRESWGGGGIEVLSTKLIQQELEKENRELKEANRELENERRALLITEKESRDSYTSLEKDFRQLKQTFQGEKRDDQSLTKNSDIESHLPCHSEDCTLSSENGKHVHFSDEERDDQNDDP